MGSDIVFDAKGDVVTNNHVVNKAGGFQVALANARQYRARLVDSFPADDLAVLHIDAGGLHPAVFADSSRLQVGDVALAIGNPLGLQSSVTEGIDSALGRTVNEDNGVALPDVIQTSAAINPGNSGGAHIATQLIGQGKVTSSHRAYLGVEVAATTSGGLLVTKVQPGGPAARAGIHEGELITAADGAATPDQASLADVLTGLDPGQHVTAAVAAPDGAKQTVRVTLGQLPG